MRVWIDQRSCVGNGICAEIANDVFSFDGDLAYVCGADGVVRDQGVPVRVPPGREEAVLEAADECPVACIYVDEG
jgi:ferredoxin